MAQTDQQVYVKRSIQIPETIDRLWADTSRKTGLNKTAALINAIRAYAKSEGVQDRESEEASA